MRQLLLPIGIGLLTPIVAMLGGAPFDIPGQNPPAAILAGSVAVTLYFTATTYGLVRERRLASRVSWPISATLLLSLLAVCVLVTLLEGGMSWLFGGLPMLVSGCLGVAIALLLSYRKPVPTTTRSHTQ